MAAGKEYKVQLKKKKIQQYCMVLYSGTTTYTHTHRHTQTHILSYRNENKQTAAAPNSMDKSYKDVK